MANEVLWRIFHDFLALPGNEVERNNIILRHLLDDIIYGMGKVDDLFRVMFRRIFYAGSYYDGLILNEPEEHDLDLLLALPKAAEPALIASEGPGFVHLQARKCGDFVEAQTSYRNFGELFDDEQYLDTGKVMAWMEGALTKVLGHYAKIGRSYLIQGVWVSCNVVDRKGGPALALHITDDDSKVAIDVDLVPCFVFAGSEWPMDGFRPNPIPNSEFFIVPKWSKGQRDQQLHRYWRFSFQEQERELMLDFTTQKPAIKLLKKMRDNLGHSPISSYCIKTVALWIDEEDRSFWNNPLSHVFLTVLKRYRDLIAKGNIPYYWCKRDNLLGNINGDTLTSISNKLTAVIDDVERNPQEPGTIAKYLLNQSEYRRLENRPESSCGIL